MKRIFMLIVLVFMVSFLAGCNGTVTRALRHEGFTVSGDIECKMLYDGTTGDKVKYFTGSKFITDDGRIYDFSMDRVFSSGSNCRLSETELRVSALFDYRAFKGTDGKFYLLSNENGASEYQEITGNDTMYQIYETILAPADTIRVVTGDSSQGIYYVLKNDGNVYKYVFNRGNDGSMNLVNTTILYNSADYGGNIVDFNYAGNSASTFVKTDSNKVFFMKPNNAKECSQYADVACKYEMMEAPFFEKYHDYVLVYNGQTVVTTYGRVFTVIG